MNNLNKILLRRKGLVFINNMDISTTRAYNYRNSVIQTLPKTSQDVILAATVAKNMEALGYRPGRELFESMMHDGNLSMAISEQIIPELKELKGANVDYKPMYPNFPEQVANMSEAELYYNAIIHYATSGELRPNGEKEDRKELKEDVKMSTIDIGTEKDAKTLFANLLNSITPWSDQDKDDITTLMLNYDFKRSMPKFMTNRENLAILANMVSDLHGKNGLYAIVSQVRTTTDVLRIMNVVHGDGDPTLASKVKINSIGRADKKIDRRTYLAMINKCKNAAEDMKVNKTAWIKIGERLHPGEYKEKYPNAFDAFNKLRDKNLVKDIKTFNAKAEMAAQNVIGGKDEIVEAFNKNPGMMARNLDRMLRKATIYEIGMKDAFVQDVIDAWIAIAPKASVNVLWQVYSHFDKQIENMDEENKFRVFSTKDKNSKTIVRRDEREQIPMEYCKAVKDTTLDAIKERYRNKPNMGKVYVDPSVAECKVPNGTRGAQKGTTTVARGSKIPLNENCNIIRSYIWWTNTAFDEQKIKQLSESYRGYGPLSDILEDAERVDMDLSSGLLDKDLNLVDRISYYSLCAMNKHHEIIGVHSGDIVNGGPYDGKGAAEFVDIDINKAMEMGARYFYTAVNSYSEQPFSSMEHAHFGFMEREALQSGEIFEPSTVKTNIKLTANAKNAIMCMFDLKERKMIWMDEIGMDSFRTINHVNNLDGNLKGSQMVCYKALHLEKPDIIDVIKANVDARGGEFVDNKDDADIVFAMYNDNDKQLTIKPGDIDYFAGDLMPEALSEPIQKMYDERAAAKAAATEKGDINIGKDDER